MIAFSIFLMITMFLGIVSFLGGLAWISIPGQNTEDGISFLIIGLILVLVSIYFIEIIYPIAMGG